MRAELGWSDNDEGERHEGCSPIFCVVLRLASDRPVRQCKNAKAAQAGATRRKCGWSVGVLALLDPVAKHLGQLVAILRREAKMQVLAEALGVWQRLWRH